MISKAVGALGTVLNLLFGLVIVIAVVTKIDGLILASGVIGGLFVVQGIFNLYKISGMQSKNFTKEENKEGGKKDV